MLVNLVHIYLIIRVRYLSQRLFPKGDFPRGNFLNVLFSQAAIVYLRLCYIMPSRALLQAATEADRCSLKQLGGQALRVQQT